LRALEASIPDERVTVRKQIDNLVNGMADLYTELQELSRGIHPAILSKGGLGPAIKTLARRSTVPVGLDLAVDGRLPESIEVAGYYVIAEALTNVVKHAGATEVTVRAGFDCDELRLEVSDNGVGGARSGGGSGLIGLKDRVEAVSGRLDVVSVAGSGTTVTARIPVPGGRNG
jgi:signal transduction histidine kinase